MRITITPPAASGQPTVTPFLLCDDSVGAGALSGSGDTFVNGAGGQCKEGFNADEQRATQREEFIGSEYAMELPRGNRQFTMTFTVQRTMESVDAALMFMADHPDLVPDTGKTEIDIGNTVRYLYNSVVKSVRVTNYCGVSFDTTYTISGSYVPPIYGAAGTGTGGSFATS